MADAKINEQFVDRTPLTAVAAWLLLLLGLGLMVTAFVVDASVAMPGAAYADRVNNIGLLNTKLMLAIVGSAFFISGTVVNMCRRP